MNVLVVSAHHDDEVIGCGGTVCRHVEKGDDVYVAYVSAGLLNVPGKTGDDAINTIEKEARNAGEVLGVRNQFFLREKDRFIEYGETALKKLIACIRTVSPSRIYTHHEGDGDADHMAVYKLVKEAFWLASVPAFPDCGKPVGISDLFLFEVWTPMSDYQLVVDITDYLGRKVEALRQYTSPLSVVKYDRAVEGLNAYRGEMTSAGKYAEVFRIKRIFDV